MRQFLFSFLIIATFLFSCKKNINTDSVPVSNEEQLIQPEPIDTFFSIMVNDLRMRSKPDLKSEVIHKLKLESEVLYLNKRTDFRSSISIGGKMKDEPWYEVTTRDGQFKGWVYGGGIQLIDAPSVQDHKLSSDRLVYSIEDGTQDNLESLFKILLPGSQNRFKGFYEYKPGLSGSRILDGNIRLETRYLLEKYNVEVEIHIDGRFRNGKKDGAFISHTYYPESESFSTLYYEESQEKCLWGSYYGKSEGEIYSYREDQPVECDFEYLKSKAELMQ